MNKTVIRILMLTVLAACLCLSVYADGFLGGNSSDACTAECAGAYEVCINECSSGVSNGGQMFCSENCLASYIEGVTYCQGLSFFGF
jgi:hypothetical protein